MTLQQRFSEKYVHASNGCWLWTACADKDGYGFIRHKGKNLKAHRVSFELARGIELQKGQFVCHSCDTPACVNPAHLWLGDHTMNQRDCARKGRCRIQKLNAEQALDIRRRYLSGESPSVIAAEHGIVDGYVINIAKKRKWAHVD
jgi:hypothetical protein